MKATLNSLPDGNEQDAEREKPSRAAEFITALYVVLVLLTPWLLRDAPLFAPAKGVEIQMSRQAQPQAPELKLQAAPQGQATNLTVRAH